jgi:hypothetical protein
MEKIKSFLNWCVSSWTGSIVLAVCLAAVIVIPSFKHRAPPEGPVFTVETAQAHMSADGLPQQWQIFQPSAFGVETWNVGDFSRYHFDNGRTDTEREVSFSVVGSLESDHAVARHHNLDPQGLYWLEVGGFRSFREVYQRIYQLVSVEDLRVRSSELSLLVQDGYFGLHNTLYDPYPPPPFAALTKLDEETITTPAGSFECDHYLVEIGEERIEVWADPAVSPMGIIRVVTRDQTLELIEHGIQGIQPLSPFIQPLIDGRSTLVGGCASCHGSYHDCHTRIYPPK